MVGYFETSPPPPVPEATRQAVLDAVAVLQVRRSELAKRVREGSSTGAEVIGVGLPAINAWFATDATTWHESRSTRTRMTLEQARAGLPLNRHLIEGGLHLTTVYDLGGFDARAGLLIGNETLGTYLQGLAPIQMTIVDGRYVLLHGPIVDGQVTVIRVTAPSCLRAAEAYWTAVVQSAVPLSSPPTMDRLTPRQRQVTALLRAGYVDDAIAASLGVSVRTVRSDVAGILDALGVHSRFAAGAVIGAGPVED